jgi:hypothetical protein
MALALALRAASTMEQCGEAGCRYGSAGTDASLLGACFAGFARELGLPLLILGVAEVEAMTVQLGVERAPTPTLGLSLGLPWSSNCLLLAAAADADEQLLVLLLFLALVNIFG